MSIIITGASGHLGRSVAERVLKHAPDTEVVLTTRRPEALSDLAGRGVEVRRADFDRPETLAGAFADGERLLLISSDVVGDARVVQHLAAIEAARRAGVRHVVYTSALNPVAENPAAVAPDHRETERALRESGLTWTALRNGLYAEFQIPAFAQAVAAGRLVHNGGDGRTAYVSREDCAAVAAAVLTDKAGSSGGRAYDVTGPESLSQEDVAALLGELSGRPVEAVAVDDEAFVRGLVDSGLPEPAARGAASFGMATREGYFDGPSGAVSDLTGRPPRSLREVFDAHHDELVKEAHA